MLTIRLNYFLETYDILEEEQAGFRKGMPTSILFLKHVHAIKAGFNSKKSTLAFPDDFQGEYDTICRKRLLKVEEDWC
ncbi:hypothetical protein CEXT_545521 [Caerostris extrusa]|uniref:Uncharacterized protein n=1 Tax=Caerostris extrusa TaxID=172846 RepID=A0AAV4ND44_CAEEX|nr:hypothetical protein CEXT_545521 [Caerostris extrusa]